MRVNVCVNGTFRYPSYIRHYERAGVLGSFTFAHRPRTGRAQLGLSRAHLRNIWLKEMLLQAAWRMAPSGSVPHLSGLLCDRFQEAAIRDWRSCDSLETVIGAVADRVIRHARTRGTRVLGHAVMSHPAHLGTVLARAHEDLGLDPASARFPDEERRCEEIAACDRILVDSTASRRSFLAQGVGASKVVTVTPAVDLDRFSARSRTGDGGTFRVICVGTVTPRKGQHLLLRAWATLKLPRAELVLVGLKGRHAAHVVRGYEGTFRHVPSLPAAQLCELLGTGSLFVMPSIEDGFAQAPLEAMSCGLPVIVTDNVGMADLVRDGENGFVVPAFDADTLAARIVELYRDPDRRRAMGQAAAATAAQLPGWADYVERVLAIHRTLVSQGSAA